MLLYSETYILKPAQLTPLLRWNSRSFSWNSGRIPTLCPFRLFRIRGALPRTGTHSVPRPLWASNCPFSHYFSWACHILCLLVWGWSLGAMSVPLQNRRLRVWWYYRKAGRVWRRRQAQQFYPTVLSSEQLYYCAPLLRLSDDGYRKGFG